MKVFSPDPLLLASSPYVASGMMDNQGLSCYAVVGPSELVVMLKSVILPLYS